ncbi:NAD-P-binding protein [Dentipellis sp. KUC8613]|nr:NAD-P-binding protein [Dentipellis sp. KUC8613]
MASSSNKQVVAIAGAGDTAKYLVEELEKDGSYDIHLISRAERQWFNRPSISLHLTDYSESSLLSILNTTGATILFSFIHSNDHFYNDTHLAMLAACAKSTACKRFVPSEYGGDLVNHADKPRMYIPTHGKVRRALREHKAKGGPVEWTLVNQGWFMDYFVPLEKRYFKSLGPVWPLDTDTWEALIPGTGEEQIGWTAGRDVARALLRLIQVPSGEWPEEVYLQGDVGTWHQALAWVEEFYGRKFTKISYQPASQVYQDIVEYHNDPDNVPKLLKAYMDEWNFSGASANPREIVEAQREQLFPGLHFHTVKEIMEIGMKSGHI